jgi:hypothetical protein
MFSLNCPFYTKQFYTAEELVIDATLEGVDLDLKILFNGQLTGETLETLVSQFLHF